MAKLSEPVAKAFETLLERCKGDTMVFMRTITGNYSADEYFHNLPNEINLLRCANFNDILSALVGSFASSDAIKTTEQPSKAAAVEGILTEEELKERNRLLVLENDELNAELHMWKSKFNKSLEWLETIENEFYHDPKSEVLRCRTQAKCAREELTNG